MFFWKFKISKANCRKLKTRTAICVSSTPNIWPKCAQSSANQTVKAGKSSNYKNDLCTRLTRLYKYQTQVVITISQFFNSFTRHCTNRLISNKDISFSFRRQRLDADSLLPPPVATNLNSSATISAANHRPNVEVKDPYIIDVVKIADERIQELEALLNQSKQSGEIWEKKCSNLKYQVCDFCFFISIN